ncbi:hypothetical protein G6F45_013631 [Rhizopus arrhizus]|uniref:Uncharacterized protein n=1 Tax=Rhizopus delemar TaxID=936053 RepID=A0A9P6YE01_9FUNG|nr:hypothetical protein G6F50_013734 [Rhizopus delemar]KAG1608191.1 hypothetical protein G6F45_013631 [Rhizopus arrhizus]
MPTVKQLQAELAAAKAEINRLQQQNASLLERLAQAPSTTVPKRVPIATVPRPPASPSSLQLKPPTKRPPPPELESAPLQKASKPKYAPPLPSQTAAARTFSPPSTNQGFKYLYLPIQRRLPIRQIRSLLRRLHINSNRVLDIHYPDRHLKNLKSPYMMITILWIQTTFEILTMTTSIKMKRSVPHGASSLNA